MSKQLMIFRDKLGEFAAKYKNEIKKDPQFRRQFQEMCASIGVDPLACTNILSEYNEIRECSIELFNIWFHLAGKGFWSEVLGVGDFYYELGVQIIEICLATSHRNGGKTSI